MSTRWDDICSSLCQLREHLDNVSDIWKQFNELSEELEQWLVGNLNGIKTTLDYSTVESVKLEIEMLRSLQHELDAKVQDKETLKDLTRNLSQRSNR